VNKQINDEGNKQRENRNKHMKEERIFSNINFDLKGWARTPY
jgi:hypothetical protein